MTVIDGLVSGLDTTAIIRQLIAVERVPIQRLQDKSSALDKKLAAWRDIEAAFGTLRTASQKLANRSSFTATAVSSSAAELATASAVTGAPLGDVKFRVHRLATAHQQMSAAVGTNASLTGAGRLVAGVGLQQLGATSIAADPGAAAGVFDVEVAAAAGSQVTVTVGASSVTVDRSSASVTVGGVTIGVGGGGLVEGKGRVQVVATTDTTTMGGLSGSFSAPGSIVSAQLISVGAAASPERRLVFSSLTTGAAGSLLVGQGGLSPAVVTALGSMTELTAAQDARIELGTTGLMIDRATNNISDVFDGVSLQLQRADPATDVTVSVKRDTESIVTAVKDWVNAMNGALATIDAKSAYAESAAARGPLLGDSSARTARDSLLSFATSIDGSGTLRNLAQVGVTLDAKGRFAIDEATLQAELGRDPAAVSALFSRSGSSSTGAVEYVSSGDRTLAGTYAIAITQASAPAQLTGAAFGTLGADETVDVRLGSVTASVTLRAGDDVDAVVSAFNSAFLAHNMGVVAENAGGALRLRSVDHGSNVALSVRSSRAAGADSTGMGGAAAGTYYDYTGVDVAGTIDGVAATGSGQVLTANTGAADQLQVRVLSNTIGSLGTLTYSPGRAGQLIKALGADGSLAQPVESAQENIGAIKKSYQSDIERYEQRVLMVEQRYRRQFAQLEALLGQLRAQGSRLSASINSLPNANGNSQS